MVAVLDLPEAPAIIVEFATSGGPGVGPLRKHGFRASREAQKSRRKTMMRDFVAIAAACAVVGVSVTAADAQQNDFPMAAPAGVDSKAREVAPAGAGHQSPFHMNTRQYSN